MRTNIDMQCALYLVADADPGCSVSIVCVCVGGVKTLHEN